MGNQNKILLSSPHMSGREQKYIQEAFDTNWIAPLGTNVDNFEKELANYNGTKGAAVLTSGTAAIHLALDLLGVGRGDVVFCSTFTFIASVNPILYLGGTPVLIDSEPETWNMSVPALTRALKEASERGNLPKAVIIVNLYGQPARMDELIALCETYGVPVIEDAAESLGSEYKGRKSGTFGEFGVYSFNGNKIITSSGGGALVSNDEVALQKVRFLATQARDPAPHYQHSEIGYNYRMSNIVAGIGRGQLEVLNERVKARREIFERYYDAIGHVEGIQFQPELADSYSNRWLTALTIDSETVGVDRNTILGKMADEQIECRPTWKPMHLQPLFKDVVYYSHEEDHSVSDQLFEQGICLPSGSNMTKDEQARVIAVLSNYMKVE